MMHLLVVNLLWLAADPPPEFAKAMVRDVKPLISGAITVMKILIPLVAVFRIVYKFAEGKEGSVAVLVAEVVLIIFVSFAVGQLIQLLVDISVP